jgi:hypothetical protein
VTPWYVALAPPGAYVNASYELKFASTNFTVTEEGGSTFPSNVTNSQFEVDNWTLTSESSRVLPGWGPRISCAPYTLAGGPDTTDKVGSSGCGGCQVAPPVPGGVGQRLSVPEQFYYGSTPSTIINASYNSAPIASFSFQEVDGGIQSSSPGNFSGLPVTFGSFYEYGKLYGFELSVSMSTIQFGIPIHLTNGTSATVPEAFPAGLTGFQSAGTVSFSVQMTYVFPSATSEGTWNVYAAGSGSPYSVGGLLFEQTAIQP